MSKNEITIYSKIEYARLEPKQGSLLNACLHGLNGKNVKISISEVKNKRSLNQNSYYWGVVLPNLVNAINEHGNNFNSEELHIYLKQNVVNNMIDIVYLPDGSISKKIKSTTKLSKKEFSEYLEQIMAWGADVLDVIVPEAE